MSRSQNSFIKKQKAEKKRKKQQEKFEKRLEKKNIQKSGNLQDMLAYVDEFGNITSEPQDTQEQKNKEDTDEND